MADLKKCSVCGKEDKIIFRCPDGKDKCIKCIIKE